jgi:hypothetical protein
MFAKLVSFFKFLLICVNLNYLLIIIFYFSDLYNDNQAIIICMLAEQAKKLITLEWFQIDVSFKRVKGEINEFEINIYDSKHHLSK